MFLKKKELLVCMDNVYIYCCNKIDILWGLFLMLMDIRNYGNIINYVIWKLCVIINW